MLLILVPFFSSKIIEQIKENHFFLMSFDGSNKGNIKIFPFIVNYVTLKSGLVRSVLEVVEQPRETTDDIPAALRYVLEKNNIDIHQMTYIGADNTNVNFSRHHSVFSMIKSEVPRFLKGNVGFKIRTASVIIFSYR